MSYVELITYLEERVVLYQNNIADIYSKLTQDEKTKFLNSYLLRNIYFFDMDENTKKEQESMCIFDEIQYQYNIPLSSITKFLLELKKKT